MISFSKSLKGLFGGAHGQPNPSRPESFVEVGALVQVGRRRYKQYTLHVSEDVLNRFDGSAGIIKARFGGGGVIDRKQFNQAIKTFNPHIFKEVNFLKTNGEYLQDGLRLSYDQFGQLEKEKTKVYSKGVLQEVNAKPSVVEHVSMNLSGALEVA